LDLNRMGTFISSDEPLSIGNRFGVHLTIPVDYESSKIFRTEGTVAWNRIQLFKSRSNGMGVQFIEPLPETLLLNVLAHNIRKLMKETEARKVLEERVEKLELELEETKRLAALGRCAEKILLEVSTPILTLSGRLGIIRRKIHRHKRMLEEHEETNKEKFKRVTKDFDNCCRGANKVLRDYKIISELARIAGDDRETLESKLKRYNC
jgi:Tfp pilus assembly protein PilZ